MGHCGGSPAYPLISGELLSLPILEMRQQRLNVRTMQCGGKRVWSGVRWLNFDCIAIFVTLRKSLTSQASNSTLISSKHVYTSRRGILRPDNGGLECQRKRLSSYPVGGQ